MMVIMRYPKNHKDEVKERIVQAASQALRTHGIEGISIPALMKQAGLTHGGFYTHFENRDELVVAAVLAAARHTADSVFDDEIPLKSTIDLYLSKAHMDHPESGCVLAALGTDGMRHAPPVRAAFSHVARGFLRLVQKKVHPRSQPNELSDAALVRASTMVGAIMLSRLVKDSALETRILAAARATTSKKAS